MNRDLSIDEFKNNMYYDSGKFQCYKVSKNKHSTINVGEQGYVRVALTPREFQNNYQGKMMSSYIMTVVVLEKTPEGFNEDTTEIKIHLTASDYNWITNTLKAQQGDILAVTGNVYKSKKGFMVSGRKWFKWKDPSEDNNNNFVPSTTEEVRLD